MDTNKSGFKQLVNTLIRLSALLLIIWWCIKILSPFLIVLIWGGIIAVALEPLHALLTKIVRGKSILSAVLITLCILSIIVFPSWLIIDSLLEGIQYLKSAYENGEPLIPPPGEATREWPEFTKPFIQLWQDASANIGLVMNQHADQIKGAAIWFFEAFSDFGIGILQFIISVIIAGVLLVYSKTIAANSNKLFLQLAGNYGKDFGTIAVTTIRSVVKGILGVAIIQSSMAGIGFFMAGIPFAGFWTITALFLAVIQVGAGPVIIPVIIYAYNTNNAVTATILTVWLIIAMFSDNVLKPLLLGRNAPAPMLVIFLGSIGGFITFGFIGLFFGAVVLTLGYKLFDTWLNMHNVNEA